MGASIKKHKDSPLHHAIPFALVVAATIVVTVVAENLALGRYFPHLARLPTDFSSHYLRRELRYLAVQPPQTIILGDSVLWGYRLQPDQTAVSILDARGCRCYNLSFKLSSPPNYYALARLMQTFGVHPAAVVVEVSQRVLNPANDAYRSLHPGVAQLADPLLSKRDRRLLTPTVHPTDLEGVVASFSLLFAMRADIRETLYPQRESAPLLHPGESAFEGEYDLSPLDPQNVGVHFLMETVNFLRQQNVRTIAIMTPTNHGLLHDYIDGSEYRDNNLYLQRLLRRDGAEVVDLDRVFPTSEFYDDVHLTAAGQRKLASILSDVLSRQAH